MAEKDTTETVKVEGLGEGAWDPKNNKLSFSNDSVKKFAAEHGVEDYFGVMKAVAGVWEKATEAVVPVLAEKVAASHEKAECTFGVGTGHFDVGVDAERTRRNPKDANDVWNTYGEVSLRVSAPKPKITDGVKKASEMIEASYKRK